MRGLFYDGVVKVEVRQLVKDEIRDMKRQMADDPYSEPEPTSRFDRMTPVERHFVASELGERG